MNSVEAEVMETVAWDELSFTLTPTRSMYLAECKNGEDWSSGGLTPFGDFSISPAAGVLNYGQGVFEGMKAYRSARDRVVLFRPERNARRFRASAQRLCIPPLPEEIFMEAVFSTVDDNLDFVPPLGKGSLYIRPCLWGTGSVLGVQPAPSYTFALYVSPVGPYFKGGMRLLHLEVTKQFHRAAPRGTGNAKVIGNYAASLYPLKLAKAKGFDEILYLNAADEDYVEEVGSANLFILSDGVLKTPALDGAILPGITRDSVIRLAREKLNMEVRETQVSVSDVLEADEVFCTGTAAVITPIGEITTEEGHNLITETVGSVSRQLYDLLTGIQKEEVEDPFGWVMPLTE